MARLDYPTRDDLGGSDCDLVMKGGITSGIVYPLAACELARQYRFRSIGGSSAGAIGAVMVAAAEHGRDSGGFRRLAEIPTKLGPHLGDLFTPGRAPRRRSPCSRDGCSRSGRRASGSATCCARSSAPSGARSWSRSLGVAASASAACWSPPGSRTTSATGSRLAS